jgi:hypothetical protein
LSDSDIAALADKVADRIAGNDDTDEDGGDDDDDEQSEGLNRHEIDQLADLVCEATEGRWQRPQALHFMMHTARGASMVGRLRKAVSKAISNKRKRKEQPMTWETLEKFVKETTAAKMPGGRLVRRRSPGKPFDTHARESVMLTYD